MEKRLIIAIGLSVLIIVGFNMMFPQAPPAPVKPSAVAPAKPGEAPPAAATTTTSSSVPANTSPAGLPVHTGPETLTKVDTDLYTAEISSSGGVIKSWRLKKYKDTAGNPLEMVVYPDGMKPLVVVPEGTTWQEAQGYAYSCDSKSLELTGKDQEGVLHFSYRGQDGRSIQKTIKFKNGTYAAGLDVDAQGYKGYSVYMGESFGSMTAKDKKGYGTVGPLVFMDGKRYPESGIIHWIGLKLGTSKPEAEGTTVEYKGKKGWAAIEDKYFMAAILPSDGIKAVIGKGASDWGFVGVTVPYDGGGPKMNAEFYAGPKQLDRLKAIGGDLDRAVDFGMFTFFAKPLFVALKFFYDLVGNYGWSIIIITVIIKLLFAPLTHKSQKSMKRMQKLQPLFAELKEKFKGDPQKLNREMMELYKKHKVNPMSGCLPMLIQIPVFIALYNVLNNAIELRRAPFAFWLQDLSLKDPYYVLPIMMGLSMLAMQKMTPTSADPNQNKIMMLMPVFLTFMFISLPSGLVLYFTVSNLLSMAQQVYINKYSND